MTNKAMKYGLMTIAAVLLVVMAFAGAASAHDNHDGKDWMEITDLSDITSSGNYYLADSIDLTSTWTVPDGLSVNLCLNGKVINGSGSIQLIVVPVGTELNIYDCDIITPHYFDFTPSGRTFTGDPAPDVAVSGLYTLNNSVTSNVILGGVITGGYATSGGAIQIDGGHCTLYGGHITGNCATSSGGAINISNNGQFTLEGGNLSYNKASAGGGCVDVLSGSFTMNGGEISYSDGNEGGGVYVKANALFTLNDGIIHNCTGKSPGGVSSAGLFTMNGGKICFCKGGMGGGITNGNGYKGITIMNGGRISNCYSIGYCGGGAIHIQTYFEMNGGDILDCWSNDCGGAIALRWPSLQNLPEYEYHFVMNGGNISGCTNTGACGGAIYAVDSKVLITGGKITNCYTSQNGGGICMNNANACLTVTGGEIFGNKLYPTLDFLNNGADLYSNLGTVCVSGLPNIHGNISISGSEGIKVTGALDNAAYIGYIKEKAGTIVNVTYDGGTAFAVRNNFALNPASGKVLKAIDSGDVHKLVVADAGYWSACADTTWYNNQDTEFTLSTPEQLAGLAELVNTDVDDFAGKTVKLGADIDLSGKEWTPIGNLSANPFSGDFDGEWYVISNLSSTRLGSNCGLFFCVYDGSVKRVIIDSCVISGNQKRIGGLISYANSTEIEDCLVRNSAFSSSFSSTDTRLGGLVGLATVSSAITNSSVENCTVICSYDNSYNVGGIVGTLEYSSTVDNCSVRFSEITGVNRVGGIAGKLTGSAKMFDCMVIASNVTGSSGIGGLAGRIYEQSTITGSLSLGIGIVGTDINIGRICGGSDGTGSITKCYAWDGMKINDNLVSLEDDKNGTSISSIDIWNNQSFFQNSLGWNFDNVWKMNNGNDNYKLPVLKWQTTPVSGDASYLIPITVTFDTQGGSAVSTQNISKGLNATRPADNPTKAGYTFENWYNESACTGVFDFTARLTADTTAYANWTVKTTNVIASDNKAEFGNDNVTALHSTSGTVVKVLLEDVSNVANSAVNFTADNTSVQIPSSVSGYNQEEISVFEINATADGTAKINVTITFNDAATATAEKDNVSFFHYVDSEWKPLNSTIAGQNSAEVLYTVETTSFSPFGIGLSSPITYTVHFDANGGVGSMADMTFTYDVGQNLTANAFQRYNSNFLYWTYNGTKYYNTDFVQNLTTVDGYTVEMVAQWETYSTGGSSSGSTYMGSNSASYTPTQQPTVKPTVEPTATPTEKPATPTVIATAKPTTQATQSSPAPFLGLLAGLGAAAVLLRLRK